MSEEKKGFFARLKEGLTKTRDNIVRGIDSVFSGFSAIDDDFYEELEEILIMGDIGVNATTAIVERLKQQVKEKHIKEPSECKQLLIESIKEQMQVDETAYNFEKEQSVIMVIGVNGVGKTTSVGKLAGKLKDEGRKVLIAAADTFRAAAGDQLAEWASRADVPMIGGKEGADPASVVFDAVNAAKARGVDVLLVDTAGRLHNKKNLMEELRKMNRIIDKEFPNAHRENLIVLDGTTGQNALVQAREFGACVRGARRAIGAVPVRSVRRCRPSPSHHRQDRRAGGHALRRGACYGLRHAAGRQGASNLHRASACPGWSRAQPSPVRR